MGALGGVLPHRWAPGVGVALHEGDAGEAPGEQGGRGEAGDAAAQNEGVTGGEGEGLGSG